MGSSSESRRNNEQLNRTSDRDLAISQSELEHNRGLREQEQGYEGRAAEGALGGYESAQTGGLTDDQIARLRELSGPEAAGGGGGGGDPLAGMWGGMAAGNRVDLGRLRGADPVWQDMMATGGFSDAVRNSLASSNEGLKMLGKTGGIDDTSMNLFRGDGGYKRMADTGGMTDENRANIRAGGVFDEFAKTGGMSDLDKSLIRDRINAAIPASYDAMQRGIGTTNRVVGNAGPGSAALTARMGRDASREIANTSKDAEMELLDRIMSGRKWGAEGMSNAELGLVDRDIAARQWGTEGMSQAEGRLQGLRTGNIEKGSQGAFTNEYNLYDTIAQNRMGGATGYQEMERYNQDLLRSESDRAMAGMSAGSGGGGGRGRDVRGDQLDTEWDIIDFQNRNRQFGAGGMADMYGATSGNVQDYSDRTLQSRSQDVGGNLDIVNTRHDINPSRMSQIQAGVGTAAQLAGAVGGAMSGAGAIGGVANAVGGMSRNQRRREGTV